MELFFDTSAIIPLLLIEPHSPRASEAWAATEGLWAWRWMEVEAEAALGRRGCPPEAWAGWRAISARIHWLDLETDAWPQLRAFNRSLCLRAADAGHLFVLEQLVGIVPRIKLVTFDSEMQSAAKRIGLPVWE